MNAKIGRLVGAVAVSLLVFSAQRSDAKCDPTADAADLTLAQAAAATCVCATFDNHGQYVSCVAHAVNDAPLANHSCGAGVKKCAARSTCGKPDGFVTCCRTKADGTTKCSTKSSAERCTPPKGGSACVGVFASCCDACTESGCASPSGAFLGD